MALAPAQPDPDRGLVSAGRVAEPAISWGAVWAGVATTLAVSVFLTLLAAGFGMKLSLGLASGASMSAFTPELGAWAVAGQCVAGALGGYVAGRLRGAWPGVHLDEAHFRDTAHGLVVWAASTVLGVLLAAFVLAPYAAAMAATTSPLAIPTATDAVRAAHIASQAAFFTAVGLLLSAFVCAVAARIGGQRGEEMLGRV